MEQANKALSRELEEVKSTLNQTEQTLKAVEEQKTIYYNQISKTSTTLMSTVKGLLAVLKKVHHFQTYQLSVDQIDFYLKSHSLIVFLSLSG